MLAAGVMTGTGGRTLPKYALAIALFIPVVGATAGTWYAFNPGQLKTERELIARLDALPGVSRENLFYLGEAPFSARFYSHGDVRSISQEALARRLAQGSEGQPVLLAVYTSNKELIRKLQARGQAIDTSKRYTVIRLTEEASRTAGSDTKQKERQSG